MDEWVMSCGAPKHNGWQRHHGALVNWRRHMRGPRHKVARIIKRRVVAPGEYSEISRKIFPLAWRDAYMQNHSRFPVGRPHVLNRECPMSGGPVGRCREFRS